MQFTLYWSDLQTYGEKTLYLCIFTYLSATFIDLIELKHNRNQYYDPTREIVCWQVPKYRNLNSRSIDLLFLSWATETLHYHNYMHTTDRHWMLAVSPVAYLAKSLHISFIYSWDGGEEIHHLLKNRSLRWILTIFTFNQIDFIHSSPATNWSSRTTFWHTSHPPSARKPRSHQLDLRLSISLPVQSTNSSLTSSKSIFSICFLQFTLLHFTCTRHTFSAAVQPLTAEQSKNMRCMHLTQHRGGELLSPML